MIYLVNYYLSRLFSIPSSSTTMVFIVLGIYSHSSSFINLQNLITMTQKQQLRQRYRTIGSRRQYGISMGRSVSQIISFMDSTIKKQFQSFNLLSFSICGGQRKFKIDPQFQTSFRTLSLEQMIHYYQLAVYAISDSQKQSNFTLNQDQISVDTLVIKMIKGLKIGPNYRIKLPNYILDCTHYEIQLSKYILRRSKKDEGVFILQNLSNKQQPSTIRFQLQDFNEMKMNALRIRADKNFIQFMRNINQAQSPKLQSVKENNASLIQGKQSLKLASSLDNSKQNSSPVKTQINLRSVTQEVLHNDEGMLEEIEQLIEKKQKEIGKEEPTPKRIYKNVVQIILPHLSLVDIENLNESLPIYQDEAHRLYIYQHSTKKTQYIMQLYLKHNVQTVVRQLAEVQNYKLWNTSINQSYVKLSISSDNAYLVYLKQRSMSQWFRERDFLFLRHLCKVGSTYYFIDSSVQNSHFIPFQSIIRGVFQHCITKLQPSALNQCRLLMQMDIEYNGLLTDQYKTELALRYMKSFIGLESFITRFKGQFKNRYNLNWEICLSTEQLQPSNPSTERQEMSSNLFNQPLQSFIPDEQSFYSIQTQSEPIFQITQSELAQQKRKAAQISFHQQKINVNEQGLVILPKNYINIKHETQPVKIQERRKKYSYTNLVLKNDFKVDKAGGLVLINQPKIAAQDNVIKFIMSTLKKNIFSGKGILNISLPVQIFNCDSNLQRLCQSLSLAPELIQRKACSSNPIERFKQCIAFAFTNSILYFDIEKPFNPILGQTFQGFIDGCPIYAQQIRHHPPITSIYFIGRGYKIYGNLQAKVYVHMNSGEGVNQGFYTVQFDDGAKIIFQTCPGELSGLAIGERKFRFKGKSYILDAKNRLFCAINFEDQSGLFSKNKWEFSDQIQGEILRVKQSFIHNFFESKQGKDAICPSKKDIQQRLGKLSGRWIDSLLIDNKQYYSVQTMPYDMIHYQFPLNSNSDYRQDLYYRKFNDLARSQNEKERLEVIQRNDRKLREKYHPKSH